MFFCLKTKTFHDGNTNKIRNFLHLIALMTENIKHFFQIIHMNIVLYKLITREM